MNRVTICVLAAITVCSCQIRNNLFHHPKEDFPVRVKVLNVVRSRSISRNSYMGEVVPVREVILTAPYSGTLKSLDVSKGNIVNGKDVVAVLSSQQVKSSYSIARADLDQARDAMERMRKVYGSGSVTEVQLKDVQTKLEKAQAAMASARKAVADCSLKAPYRGVVSEIYPSAGEELTMGTRIMKITDVSDLKLNISVHENEIGSIRTGMTASVDIPALGVEKASAKVTEKGVLSSKLAHSYQCSLKMDVPQDGLMPGMAVKVRFESEDENTLVVIPASAVQIDSHGSYVWLSDTSCTVVKRRIVQGGYSGKGIIVSQGLEEGDKVICEGYQKVSTGMKVSEVE